MFTYNRLIKYDSKKIYELSENDLHERLLTKFCKSNLRVKCNVNIAYRAELGRFPLTLDVNTQIIKYHDYLDNLSLSRPILLDAVKCSKNLNNISWHKYSETLMYKNNVRLENLQRTANNETNKKQKSESLKIKKKLQKNYLEFYYKEKLASSEKITLYKHLDRNYSLAPYLSKIKNHKFRQALTKMRISAHNLEIETGRYTKPTREERLCKLCSLEFEDEMHFIMSCPKLSKRRTTFDKIIIDMISEWNDHDNLTKCFIIINPSEKIAVTSAQFCHELLRNKILP